MNSGVLEFIRRANNAIRLSTLLVMLYLLDLLLGKQNNKQYEK